MTWRCVIIIQTNKRDFIHAVHNMIEAAHFLSCTTKYM